MFAERKDLETLTVFIVISIDAETKTFWAVDNRIRCAYKNPV